MEQIKYKEGFKYQLVGDYVVEINLDLPVGFKVVQYYIELSHVRPGRSLLRIFTGYAWDGASGPTWDDKKNMRSSLVHDVLYQLMRYGFLSRAHRKQVDMIFRQMCIDDGMNRVRAWYYYHAVRKFAGSAVMGRTARKVLVAP